jgi:hypothetical protein
MPLSTCSQLPRKWPSSWKDVSADYVFFCAHPAKEVEDEAAKVNNTMMQNFLEALVITSANKQLKRFILTTG